MAKQYSVPGSCGRVMGGGLIWYWALADRLRC